MRIITAPETYKYGMRDTRLFLAGGIVNCPNWQAEVIDKLQRWSNNSISDNLVVFNPRRENFPIGDKNAARKQITWEFEAIEMCDIFSMWFCNANSDQPICMYELGRNLERLHKNPYLSICIGVEPGYRREQDVYIQTELVEPTIEIANSLDNHIKNIMTEIKDRI